MPSIPSVSPRLVSAEVVSCYLYGPSASPVDASAHFPFFLFDSLSYFFESWITSNPSPIMATSPHAQFPCSLASRKYGPAADRAEEWMT